MSRSLCAKCLLLVSVFWLAGAADDFPEPFAMEEYETALEEDDFFEEERDFDIPRVADRQYAEEETQTRFPVQQVRIRAVTPHPGLGISQESIQELVDEQFDAEQGIVLDQNGFTGRDLRDIGRFLRAMEDPGGRHPSGRAGPQ